MIDVTEFMARARLDTATLDAWREAGWLRPQPAAAGWAFAEVDVARAELIRDLQDDFGLNEEGVDVVLDLLDQLHGLRRSVKALIAALEVEPGPARRRIADRFRGV